VLGEPDRADRVELVLLDVAVVQVTHLGQLGEAGLGDGLLGPLGLAPRERHTQRAHAVVARGVHHHAAPPAAHVEQAHPGAQADLAGDQVVLGELSLFQGGVRARVHRAGVGHRGTEQPLVELVRDVVVVRDRLAVAGLGVPAPPQPYLLGRPRRPAQQPDAAQLPQQRHLFPQWQVEVLAGQVGQRGVEVALDLQVARDVGPGQAQLARRRGEVLERPRRTDVDGDRRVRRPSVAAIEDPHRDLVVPDDPVKCVSACHFFPLLQPDTFS
jgi:hypothetical protein